MRGGKEPDELYRSAAAEFGPAMNRLARSYEPDRDLCRDLVQDIHLALWRSLSTFDGQCSLRSWVYRVAHNTAISAKLRRRGRGPVLVSLEELTEAPGSMDAEDVIGQAQAVAKIQALIRSLKPPDDQVMLLYLEDLDAASISEITGLSPGAVATRIHRVKALLARRFVEGRRP
jgi:RNA polymerase sigma-70 factor (ECF subfamily)